MPSNFTSGWLGNNEQAWHGGGVVTEGSLPAKEAFEVADALFTVEKRELFYITDPVPPCESGCRNSNSFAVVRTDTQALLGIVSEQYELVPNDACCKWLSSFVKRWYGHCHCPQYGKKVCFTATLRGAATGIVPGDTVKIASSAILDMTARLVVVLCSPTSVSSVRTHWLLLVMMQVHIVASHQARC